MSDLFSGLTLNIGGYGDLPYAYIYFNGTEINLFHIFNVYHDEFAIVRGIIGIAILAKFVLWFLEVLPGIFDGDSMALRHIHYDAMFYGF